MNRFPYSVLILVNEGGVQVCRGVKAVAYTAPQAHVHFLRAEGMVGTKFFKRKTLGFEHHRPHGLSGVFIAHVVKVRRARRTNDRYAYRNGT